MAADAVGCLVGLDDHCCCVPTDEGSDATLDVLIAREPGLFGARDGVDVWRRHGGRKRHLAGTRPLHEPRQQISGAVLAVHVDDGIEAVEPFLGFNGVDVGELMDMSVENHTETIVAGLPLGSDHVCATVRNCLVAGERVPSP